MSNEKETLETLEGVNTLLASFTKAVRSPLSTVDKAEIGSLITDSVNKIYRDIARYPSVDSDCLDGITRRRNDILTLTAMRDLLEGTANVDAICKVIEKIKAHKKLDAIIDYSQFVGMDLWDIPSKKTAKELKKDIESAGYKIENGMVVTK